MHIGDPVRTCGKYMNWGINGFAGVLVLGASVQLVRISCHCVLRQSTISECLQEHNYEVVINALAFPLAKSISKLGAQILNKMNQYADQLEHRR